MTDYGELFRALAIPRRVGSPNHQTVREILKRELAIRGFAVEEHAFEGRPSRAFFGVPSRINGINLIAPPVRRSDRSSVWLVAHYDSKGQPISMAVRLIGFGSFVLGLLLLLVGLIPALTVLAVALLIVSMNRVHDNSPGALDNATALVAIFMTLDQLPPPSTSNVGVIFSDAEEYGLVGSRALAQDRAALLAGACVINLDGLDDAGRPTAFMHRPGPVGIGVVEALRARRWSWLPVIVDGLALRHAAGECVTIMKGNWRTMTIVHRPSDTTRRVRLDGAALVAAGLARVLRAL